MNDLPLQPRTVLVTFGSKRGGTAGIAAMVAEALREPGLHVDVQPAGAVHDIRGYDAVIVGGALYAGRWHRDARRFVQRLASDLRARPVWFFSSGPLSDSARGTEPRPTASVARLMSVAGARGHVTFGGRLQRDADGFLARAMAAKLAGDWRDPQVIRTWASGVAGEIAAAARSATDSATNTGSSSRPRRS